MHPNTTKTHQNMSLGSNGVDHVRSLPKIPMQSRGTNFALLAPVQPISHRVSCSNETIQNAPKHYKTHQFMSLASNGVDRVRSLRKTLMRFRGTNFFINCTSSIHFYQVSCNNKTNPKCTQTLRNKPILEFRVQWGGSGAFVAKNSNAT